MAPSKSIYPDIERDYRFISSEWKWRRATKHKWVDFGDDLEQTYEPFPTPRMKDPREKICFSPVIAKGPFLIAEVGSGTEEDRVFYYEFQPNETPLVYRNFAKLDGSPESFLKFADRYGNLGLGCHLQYKGTQEKFYGESLLLWQIEHWLFKTFTDLWDGINGRCSLPDLVHLDWEGETLLFSIGLKEDLDIFSHSKSDNTEIGYFMGDNSILVSIEPTGRFLWRGQVHSKNFSPKDTLPFIVQKLLADAMFYRLFNNIAHKFYINEKTGEFERKYYPDTLLSALWLQFSTEMTNERKIKRCSVCGQWVDVTGFKSSWSKHRQCKLRDGVSKHRKFASVKALIAQGYDIPAIANEVNVDEVHIRRWLEEENRKAKKHNKDK